MTECPLPAGFVHCDVISKKLKPVFVVVVVVIAKN